MLLQSPIIHIPVLNRCHDKTADDFAIPALGFPFPIQTPFCLHALVQKNGKLSFCKVSLEKHG
jgi:hypothetical protein